MTVDNFLTNLSTFLKKCVDDGHCESSDKPHTSYIVLFSYLLEHFDLFSKYYGTKLFDATMEKCVSFLQKKCLSSKYDGILNVCKKLYCAGRQYRSEMAIRELYEGTK